MISLLEFETRVTIRLITFYPLFTYLYRFQYLVVPCSTLNKLTNAPIVLASNFTIFVSQIRSQIKFRNSINLQIRYTKRFYSEVPRFEIYSCCGIVSRLVGSERCRDFFRPKVKHITSLASARFKFSTNEQFVRQIWKAEQ